ncbi:kinase-like domain, phloem protein 2-like protein [Tanacetum coccineum]
MPAADGAYMKKKNRKRPTPTDEKIEHLNISLNDIMLGTQDFSLDNLIGKGGSGPVYKGRVTCAQGCEIIAVKRLDRMSNQRETQRVTELEVLLEYKHENIIALLGRCNEKRENIMVYEYASKGSFDRCVESNDCLHMRKRLEICIDIARGLAFLHGTSGAKQEVVIHGDIKRKVEFWADIQRDRFHAHQGMWFILVESLFVIDAADHEKLTCRCNEKQENIMVYEYASKGSLDRWLKYDGLTWKKRLEICIDIARGLTFLHGTSCAKQEVVIHRDIKSKNVLLHGDWKAKIAHFGCSLICPINQEMKHVVNNAKGTPGYCDPLYTTTGVLTKESDIYSFGVLLFEMLCGRLVTEHNSSKAQNQVHAVRRHFEEGKLSEMVFEAAKKQIVPESLVTFQNIAYKCTLEERAKRPTASDVLKQLNKALEFQVEIEIWEPKIPRDFGKIIQMTYSPESYYAMSNKDICTSLHKGFLLRENKAFSLGADGRRVEVISATEFHFKSYFGPDKWIPTQESRFGQVAWIADSSMMYLQFKIKAHLLSPGVNYGMTHEEMEELKRVSMANVQQSPTDEGHWKVNMAEVQELPANEGGHVFGIVPWLLEKCCG